MAISHHLGIGITGGNIRLVEVRASDGFPAILRTDVVETDVDFGTDLLHTVPFDYSLAKMFVRRLTELLQKRPLYSTSVSIALPATVPLVTTLPIDASFSEEEKRAQLEWECRTLSSFHTDTQLQVLSHLIDRKDDTEYYLVVSLPKSTIDFLKSTFSHLTFDVKSIDVDHFIIENGLTALSSVPADSNYAVFGLFPDYCLVGLHERDRYKGFRIGTISYKEQYLPQTLKALNNIMSETGNLSLSTFYVYGPDATEHTIAELHNLLEIPVVHFNPLSKISFLAGSDAEHAAKYPHHVFDAPLCAALRGVS